MKKPDKYLYSLHEVLGINQGMTVPFYFLFGFKIDAHIALRKRPLQLLWIQVLISV